MHTVIDRTMRADARVIFNLAAEVEQWPRILPHYRWVRVLTHDGPGRRTIEMAARRDVFGGGIVAFPLRWTAVETMYPADGRIEFEHIGGVTRGMRVAWTIEPSSHNDDDDVRRQLVRIQHIFEPRWPVPDRLLELIVGEYFVNGVARRTLSCISALAEARTPAPKDA